MEIVSTLEKLSTKKGFKIVHLNVRSLVKKIDQVRLLLQDVKIDVFSVSETWLQPHLSTGLFEVSGFQMFRQDRKTVTKQGKGKRGGGLVTYVNNELASSCEPLIDLDISNGHVEAHWVYIHKPNCKDVIVCNVYRPPNGDLQKAITYLDDCLKTVNLRKMDVFMLGDFNVNYKNKKSPEYKKFHFFAQSNSLSQHINTVTRNTNKTQSLIDLILTNSTFVEQAGTLDHYISDHQPIYLVHKKSRDTRETAKFSGRSYRNFDEKIFSNKLRELDWDKYSLIKDPEEAWDFILNYIIKVLDELCPLRTFHIKNYRPDWMTKDLIEQIKDRDYFYKEAKVRGGEDAWNIAKHLRNITNSNIRQAKREFILQELKTHENDTKKFWKTIKKVIPPSKAARSNDILLKDDGHKIDRGEVAHFINNYFINVGKISPVTQGLGGKTVFMLDEESEEGRVMNNTTLDQMGICEVSEREVYDIVKTINVAKSSGLDSVNSLVIKTAFKILLPEVTQMFNLSIQTMLYPNSWKKATVVPIPKVGNLSRVQNYRPISLLPLPGKVMEKLIHKQLSTHLETQGLLTEIQHGFRKEHSTVHSVAQVTNFISKKMDSKIPTLAAFIDFRKAFDCVQHTVLLDKLKQLNVKDEVQDWVRNYLLERKQRVLANGTYSSFQHVTQGVPQGSVLGPLLYIIYANDLVKTVKHCKIAMYADDTVIYTANTDFETSVVDLQTDMNSLASWCESNGLTVNTEKTKLMLFGSKHLLNKLPLFEIKFNDTVLQTVGSYKYLGMTLDSQLNYNLHVNKLIGTATAKLKQFQRMRNFLDVKAALLVYKSMLLPILEYGDILLTATLNVNKKRLQILQNKGLRCALNKGIETSTDELHEKAKLLRLKYRREQHLMSFLYDQSKVPALLKLKVENMVTTRWSRKRLMKIKKPRTEKFKKSLAYVGPKRWNNLPETFHQGQIKSSFKLLVGKWIADKAVAAKNKKKHVQSEV